MAYILSIEYSNLDGLLYIYEAKKKDPEPIDSLSKVKKIFFYSLSLIIPVLIIIFVELLLQIFHYGGDTDLFIPTPYEDSPYYGINLNIGSRYFNAQVFKPTPRKDLFLKKKPDNSYRIFVLGGSTTAGYPYGNNITFPRILHRRLADTFPQKQIEVVNMAMTAINSYTLLDFMNEILDHNPDAILIYAGHNEYYGALGVASVESFGKNYTLIRIYLKLHKFKIVLLMRNIILHINDFFKDNSDDLLSNDPSQTEMARIVKNKNILYQDELYRLGKTQFYNNLDAICKKAKNAGIKVILSELVSNIRDQKPFTSRSTAQYPSALSVYKKAVQLEQNGKYEAAKKAYTYAKDLDLVRFRAPEEFNHIIHQIAQQYKYPVIPMKQIFEAASPNNLIGNKLMHEHLHPNMQGYFLMADAFFNTMQQLKFIHPQWNKELIKPVSYYKKTWGYTRLDSTTAALNIAQLKGGWPFIKNGPNIALSKFIPKNIVDTIALKISTDKRITLEIGHMKMVEYYKKQGEVDKALAEHLALIYTVPYLDLFYEPAIQFLLEEKRYLDALKILLDGLKYNRSGYMYKWTGQLSAVLNFTKEGIYYLEKAREYGQNDDQLLFNLGRAYYNLADILKGDRILIELKNLYPASPLGKMLENFKQIRTKK